MIGSDNTYVGHLCDRPLIHGYCKIFRGGQGDGVPKWKIGRKSKNWNMGELLRMVIINIIYYDVGGEFGFASDHI